MLKFYHHLSQEVINEHFTTLSKSIQIIIQQQTQKISYQLNYDCVYKLCRQEKQQDLLVLLYDLLKKNLPTKFNSVEFSDYKFITSMENCLQSISSILDRIAQICLYLDLNYCQRQHNYTIRQKLNQIVLKMILETVPIKTKIGDIICQVHHIRKENHLLQKLITQLKSIDNSQLLYLECFIPYYLPKLKKYLLSQAQIQFNKNCIKQYIKWADEIIKNEIEFIKKYLLENNSNTNLKLFTSAIYQIVVTDYIQNIYKNYPTLIYQQLTFPMLELLKYGSSKDVQMHIEWFMRMVIKELNQYSLQNNHQFIIKFNKFYQQIVNRLNSAQNKFDIHYRTIFTLQQWLNQDKIQIHIRLNHFINQYYLQEFKNNSNLEGNLTNKENKKHNYFESNQDTQQAILNPVLENNKEIFLTLFKFMKEKNAFQRLYRKSLMQRMIDRQYNIKVEVIFVDLMSIECGSQWMQKIQNINKFYPQNYSPQNILNVLIINSSDWDNNHHLKKSTNQSELLVLTQQFTQNYSKKNKDVSLYWHPLLGSVRITIYFQQRFSHQEFLCSTCMVNILFYVQRKYSAKVSQFLVQSSLDIDEIHEDIYKLIQSKLIICQDNNLSINSTLKLCVQYPCTSTLIDLFHRQKIENFTLKEKQQLKADRKIMVQAIIIKIMKSMKLCKRQQLIKQIQPNISKKGYNFNEEFVEAAINRMIEKEYLKDLEDGTLNYIG